MAAAKVILILIGVFILAQTTDWPFLDELTIVLLGLLVVAWGWSRLSLRNVVAWRDLRLDRFQVGEELTEEVWVSNHSRLPKLWLEVFDLSSLPNHHVSRVLHLRGRTEARWHVTTRCERRGRYRIGPLLLRSGDPFGLFPAYHRLHLTREVVVYPATEPLPHFSLPVGQLSGGAALSRPLALTTTSIAGLRDYTPGDPLNRISWSATARTGKLITKEFDHDPTADVWIVLDLDRSAHIGAAYPMDHPARREPPAPWLDTTEEYAVTIAASIAREMLTSGRNVGLLASCKHRVVHQPDRGDRQLNRILESLAVVRADGQSPLSTVLTEEQRRLAGPHAVVVITPSTVDDWVGSLAEVSGRRSRATCIIIEADTFGPAYSSLQVLSSLTSLGVPTHLIKCGDEISLSLGVRSGSVTADPRTPTVAGGSVYG